MDPCCCCCDTPAYEPNPYFDDVITYVDGWDLTEPTWIEPISVEQTYVEPVFIEAPFVEPVLAEPIYVEPVAIPAPNVANVGGFDPTAGITVVEPIEVAPVAVPAPNVAFVGGFDPTAGMTVVQPTGTNVSTPSTNTAFIGGDPLGTLDGPLPAMDVMDQILLAGRTAADNGLDTAAHGVIGTLGAHAIGRTGVATSNYGTNMTTMGTDY